MLNLKGKTLLVASLLAFSFNSSVSFASSNPPADAEPLVASKPTAKWTFKGVVPYAIAALAGLATVATVATAICKKRGQAVNDEENGNKDTRKEDEESSTLPATED